MDFGVDDKRGKVVAADLCLQRSTRTWSWSKSAEGNCGRYRCNVPEALPAKNTTGGIFLRAVSLVSYTGVWFLNGVLLACEEGVFFLLEGSGFSA